MDKRTAVFISLVGLVVYWFISPSIYSWDAGFTLPIIGFVGTQPLAFLNEYTVIVGGIFALTLFYLLSRRDK